MLKWKWCVWQSLLFLMINLSVFLKKVTYVYKSVNIVFKWLNIFQLFSNFLHQPTTNKLCLFTNININTNFLHICCMYIAFRYAWVDRKKNVFRTPSNLEWIPNPVISRNTYFLSTKTKMEMKLSDPTCWTCILAHFVYFLFIFISFATKSTQTTLIWLELESTWQGSKLIYCGVIIYSKQHWRVSLNRQKQYQFIHLTLHYAVT